MIAQNCGNCRFRVDRDCRRRAPPAYDFVRFYELELLRDLAWSLHIMAGIELCPRDDLHTEATEALQLAKWPEVDEAYWCGEWEGQP